MPEPEQVELHQPGRRAVVLVPLHDRAAVHPGPLDRHDLRHRAVADDHAPGVDAEMAGEAEELVRQLPDLRGHALRRPRPRRAACQRSICLLHASCWPGENPSALRDVAHGRAGPVADHVRHLSRPIAPVAAVDVLDDLLPAARLDVEVDVGVAVAGRGQEPLEQQAVRHRVHVRDPQRVADRGVRRRAAALAEDPRRAAEGHDVVHDQEVAGELPASMTASSRSTVATASGYSA